MTMRKLKLLDRQDGSVAVEAAFALPVLFAFFGVIAQLAMVMFVQASLDHATGEAARYATIYPTPSESEIEAKARSSTFGGDPSAIRSVTIVRGSDDGRNYAEITMVYDYPLVSWFVEGSAFALSQSRRAYLP
ncbi:TadE family protein [Parasphingorhabdus sp.]|jgi:hypothetical protein|uniref:TadE/TadG family type IV pilus assembly protein n=1 Tax=Parasphingorhabdus sp. TaxID=2709688 RepID=UPI00309E8A79|nr:pilus assembly protein [Sphingomonadales bacterium]